MMQRKRPIITIYKNDYGFTLMELMVIIAIIGILASIAIGNYRDTRMKVIETAALSETQLLGKVVYNVFLEGGDVNLSHLPGAGPNIGTLDTSGNSRSPIFKLSNGLVAQITGNSDWGGTGSGMCVAEVWHPLSPKSYWFVIDEAGGTSSFPTY
jgi:prepilin-type N-terminal cleavage/methylation domain-containing protein